MLTNLSFTNFKSWERAEVECGRITGLFGTNSSGKTSIIQFLLMLKQTKDATDRNIAMEFNGDWVLLGTIKDAIHKHDDSRSIDYSITFQLNSKLELRAPKGNKTVIVAQGDKLTSSFSIDVRSQAPFSRKLEYLFGGLNFVLEPKRSDSNDFQLTSNVKDDGDSANFDFVRTKGRAWQLPGPIKSYAFPDQARTYYQNAGFLADLEAAYESEIVAKQNNVPVANAVDSDWIIHRSTLESVGISVKFVCGFNRYEWFQS